MDHRRTQNLIPPVRRPLSVWRQNRAPLFRIRPSPKMWMRPTTRSGQGNTAATQTDRTQWSALILAARKQKIPEEHASPKRLGGFLFRAGTRGGFGLYHPPVNGGFSWIRLPRL